MIEERRKFFRVKLRKLTSVVIQERAYELIEEAEKSTSDMIYVEDISILSTDFSQKEFPPSTEMSPLLRLSMSSKVTKSIGLPWGV